MSAIARGAQPQVSVVMAVRNGASELDRTLDSILLQRGISLELLVLDDGSTDETAALLAQRGALDARLRVWHRPHQGLTASLMELCSFARAPFLARQDCGDRSLPGRLQRQLQHLQAHPEASLCSCHARFLLRDSSGAALPLFDSTPTAAQLRDGLTGPAHHGAVMLRMDAYRQVGGYRSMFRYAQDIDLWSRLVEIGEHSVLPELLYEADVAPGSISGVQGSEQRRFHHFIRQASLARRAGRSEQPWLARAARLSGRCAQRPASTRRLARGCYFIAALLLGSRPELARDYLRMALRLDPLHLRARTRLVLLRGR